MRAVAANEIPDWLRPKVQCASRPSIPLPSGRRAPTAPVTFGTGFPCMVELACADRT
jgi:hypothetical protein